MGTTGLERTTLFFFSKLSLAEFIEFVLIGQQDPNVPLDCLLKNILFPYLVILLGFILFEVIVE